MFVIKIAQQEYVSSILVFDMNEFDVLTSESLAQAARFKTNTDAYHLIQNSWLADVVCELVVVADYQDENEGYVFDMADLG